MWELLFLSCCNFRERQNAFSLQELKPRKLNYILSNKELSIKSSIFHKYEINQLNAEENWLKTFFVSLNHWFDRFFSAELPLGAHRHTDDGVHGGDDERGEGDVLHRQIHVRWAAAQRGTPPGAALRHRGCHRHLDQQGAHRRAFVHVLKHMGDARKHPGAFSRGHRQLCFSLERRWGVYQHRDLTCLLIN